MCNCLFACTNQPKSVKPIATHIIQISSLLHILTNLSMDYLMNAIYGRTKFSELRIFLILLTGKFFNPHGHM